MVAPDSKMTLSVATALVEQNLHAANDSNEEILAFTACTEDKSIPK